MTLTEAMLTKELDMSRSPVRTAIHMLQTEGLIVSDYYKSMMVREITESGYSRALSASRIVGKALHLKKSLPPADRKSIPIVLKKK